MPQRYVPSSCKRREEAAKNREGKNSAWSNFWSPLETKGGEITMPKNGNHTGQQSSKKRAGSGDWGQRLAPDDLGVVGETSPPVASCREGDNSTKPELNHVHGTTRGTNAYEPRPSDLIKNPSRAQVKITKTQGQVQQNQSR